MMLQQEGAGDRSQKEFNLQLLAVNVADAAVLELSSAIVLPDGKANIDFSHF
jgi:hypothetical protein